MTIVKEKSFTLILALAGTVTTLLGIIAGTYLQGLVDQGRYDRQTTKIENGVDELEAKIEAGDALAMDSIQRRYDNTDKAIRTLSNAMIERSDKAAAERADIREAVAKLEGRLK